MINLSKCQLYDGKELGNNLILWEREGGQGYDIIYCGSYSFGSCIGGIYVLPTSENQYSMQVIDVKFDKRRIIAITKNTENNKLSYWIIDKKFNLMNVNCWKVNCDSIIKSHVFGPFNYT